MAEILQVKHWVFIFTGDPVSIDSRFQILSVNMDIINS